MHRINGFACCGVYYIPLHQHEAQNLPLLSLTAEITLYPTYSRTVLKQHFKNPSQKDAISEASYVFPLHNTQTITSFTCHVGEDKTLNGIVQSKPKAKETYDAAISRGETAGLLSWSASDVWQTKLGNIPAGASVEVILTCIAQLQHDSEKDAIRFNLPTHIAPRYGIPPVGVSENTYSYRPGPLGPGSWQVLRGGNTWVDIDGGMKINVFVDMDAPIQMVEAPAHPTNNRIGTHSISDHSAAESSFDPRKAVLSLASDSAALDKDFVVLVKTNRSGHPSAVVQRHPTKDSVGLMLTLVPKFNLPVARPEVVFICDRSGSMSGSNEVQLRKALAVFLQSLPVGCKFNICSFGSSHSFLWKKSKTYSEETLKEAQAHVAGIRADMGGTEMFPPVKDAIERRYKDINLELLLLTDGDIWQRDQLVDYVREQCKAKTVRMFTLGIGDGISHALIDGLASVGGGYSQVVQLNEKLDSKVVRMLRAALGQHVSDYTLEFPGAGVLTAAEEEDFNMIEDVVSATESTETDTAQGKKPTKISLFDTTAELDPPPDYPGDNSDEARWSHLPKLPKLPERLQTPNVIPPLFPFSRTNAYVVFSPAPRNLPTVARLHAKTIAGDDLELEIPILEIEGGQDVCQLAARSFLQELEDGKGYLHDGLLESEGLTQEKQESKWEDIVEREGVRWGEGYGVASKWTSFVAIEDKAGKTNAATVEEDFTAVIANETELQASYHPFASVPAPVGGLYSSQQAQIGKPKFRTRKVKLAQGYSPPVADPVALTEALQKPKGGSFGSSLGFSSLANSVKSSVSSIIGGSSSTAPPPRNQSVPALAPFSAPKPMAALGKQAPAPPSYGSGPVASFDDEEDLLDYSEDEDESSIPNAFVAPKGAAAPPPPPPPQLVPAPTASRSFFRRTRGSPPAPDSAPIATKTAEERVHVLIMLQSFAGNFAQSDDLAKVVEASFGNSTGVFAKLVELANSLGVSQDIVATWAAIITFESGEGHAAEKDTWELVVEKAIVWLDDEGKNDDTIKQAVARAIKA
ncbi:hypothetical protein DRE_00956 [Drechslerella stenobrocha 248]|uniref:VWFA domain-containing protein n=1 Tax=Drechslerella stenobrocha 248 TaxID=1043628 RepID=W7HXN5_9PEZI|nr:hypothetical protein DRE_00956 [Drechslerella stenobrocha 248]